jgi:hypothetical protein
MRGEAEAGQRRDRGNDVVGQGGGAALLRELGRCGRMDKKRPVRLAYQPPASSTFLSEQTRHQQPTNSTFLSEQISTSDQPPAKRTG